MVWFHCMKERYFFVIAAVSLLCCGFYKPLWGVETDWKNPVWWILMVNLICLGIDFLCCKKGWYKKWNTKQNSSYSLAVAAAVGFLLSLPGIWYGKAEWSWFFWLPRTLTALISLEFLEWGLYYSRKRTSRLPESFWKRFKKQEGERQVFMDLFWWKRRKREYLLWFLLLCLGVCLLIWMEEAKLFLLQIGLLVLFLLPDVKQSYQMKTKNSFVTADIFLWEEKKGTYAQWFVVMAVVSLTFVSFRSWGFADTGSNLLFLGIWIADVLLLAYGRQIYLDE